MLSRFFLRIARVARPPKLRACVKSFPSIRAHGLTPSLALSGSRCRPRFCTPACLVGELPFIQGPVCATFLRALFTRARSFCALGIFGLLIFSSVSFTAHPNANSKFDALVRCMWRWCAAHKVVRFFSECTP